MENSNFTERHPFIHPSDFVDFKFANHEHANFECCEIILNLRMNTRILNLRQRMRIVNFVDFEYTIYRADAVTKLKVLMWFEKFVVKIKIEKTM